MADVIQFWELSMSTHRTQELGCKLYNGRYCSRYYCKRQGLTISADMKVSERCGIAASNGNQILGLIRRNVT